MKRSKEEKEILKSVEAGEWVSVKDLPAQKEKYQRMAAATLRKDKRISIRFSSADLIRVKQRAAEEGIPYQTLITSIIHKYVRKRERV